MTSRVRNLLLTFGLLAFALVLLGYISGEDWLAFISRIISSAAS